MGKRETITYSYDRGWNSQHRNDCQCVYAGTVFADFGWDLARLLGDGFHSNVFCNGSFDGFFIGEMMFLS